MADMTGALHETFDGREYTLRLTMLGLAKLQATYGNDLNGLLSDEGMSGTPPFAMVVDGVAAGLQKGEGMSWDEAVELADDMLTRDQTLFERLLLASFPDQGKAGNGKAPKARR